MAVSGYGWGEVTRGGGGPRPPKVILQPLGVWEAHRITWSVNGVILTRGPFTLEVHRWPFCGNGVGPEITPFTPESLRHHLSSKQFTISINQFVCPDVN